MNTAHRTMHRRGAVLIVIIIGLATFAFYNYRLKQKELFPQGLTTPVTIDQSLIQEKTYTSENDYVTFEVKYPSFSNVPDSFNATIEQSVLDAAANHVQEASDNWQARYDTQTASTSEAERITKTPAVDDKVPFYAKYTVLQANNSIVSVVIHVGGFTGGAHGYDNIMTFNYNVVAGKVITLADVYAGNPEYLQTVSILTRADLEKQFTANDTFDDNVAVMLKEGTSPSEDNFKNFTITDIAGKRSIIFYFDQYQVAPYVYGQPTVVLPLEQ